TLLDLVASFGAGFEEFLEGRAYSGGADDVVQTWEEATYLHESNVDSLLGRARTPFETVRRVTLSQLFHKLKTPNTKDDIEQLITTKAPPTLFPDAKSTCPGYNRWANMRCLCSPTEIWSPWTAP
ncbi:MAG: hypothetical protein MK126_04695, partial [Dehalococcoidia bacterium]|nr:hypothetical protein [Dehalococcoidia bacterium]